MKTGGSLMAAPKSKTQAQSKLILVTGDPICDHNYYRGNRATADSLEPRGFRFRRTGGGSLLLKDLVEKATADLDEWRTEFGLDSDFENLPSASHAFCIWEPQENDPNEKDSAKKHQVWRAVEPPLGYGHPSHPETEGEKKGSGALMPRTTALEVPPDIIVIDDAGLGFR